MWKRSKKTAILMLAAFTFILIVDNSSVINLNSTAAAGNSTPISINGNEELVAFIANNGLPGDGTYVSPYIIENFSIDASTATGILIRFTDAYLIIRNCTVEGGGSNSYRGIYLQSVTNVNISNNTTFSNGYGIALFYSSYNTLSGNSANNNSRGFHLSKSSYITLFGNNASYNNRAGIVLSSSNRNFLSGNTVNNNGDGIILSSSDHNTLAENSANNNYYGSGVSLLYSKNNTLVRNTASYNYEYGISIGSESSRNIIHHNMFLLNNRGFIQAYDDGTGNQWYDPVTLEGNYWGNYTKTGEYVLDGAAGAKDPYPLEPLDTDGDGMPNEYEINMGLDSSQDDSMDDLDQDGLSNLEEYQLGTLANNPDTDRDELTDKEELQTYATDPLREDTDLDGLADGNEVHTYTTDPLKSDTDTDGLLDGKEVLIYFTNPLNSDSDGDGLSDGDEVKKYRTDPMDSDSENDFFPDGLDYGWWGHPRSVWDNPLTRGLFVCGILGLLGLVTWAGFIRYQLPKLQQDLERLFLHFQQYVQQFQEEITTLQLKASLEELESAAAHISLSFHSYEAFYLFAYQLVRRKWLPYFLRPKLRPWDQLLTSLTQTYNSFQQLRFKRLEAKY